MMSLSLSLSLSQVDVDEVDRGDVDEVDRGDVDKVDRVDVSMSIPSMSIIKRRYCMAYSRCRKLKSILE